MVTEFTDKVDKSVVVASPKDEILDGVVVKIERGLLSEFLDPGVHKDFDNLEQEHLKFYIEVKFNDKIIKCTDRLPYYPEPMSNSKYAKFLNKYDGLAVGKIVKVDFNGKGFGSIKLD